MIKNYTTLSILLIVIILISGCSTFFGAGEEESERPEPLDAAEWPTPAANAPIPTPTLFPKGTLPPPTPTPPVAEARPSETPEDSSSFISSVTTALESVETSGETFAAEIRGLSGVPAIPPGLAPVAVGVVTADRAAIRQGPGQSYGLTQQVEKGELAGIIGRNEERSWVYVITIQKVLGWMAVDTLRITTGNLDAEPVLPPNPLAVYGNQFSSGAASASTPSDSNRSQPTTQTASVPETALADLKPIAKAEIDNSWLNMRQGPGLDYEVIDPLPQGTEVDVLALNPRQDWALVETGDQRIGWVSRSFIKVDGSLESAPQVSAVTGSTASVATPDDGSAEPVSAGAVETTGLGTAPTAPVSDTAASPNFPSRSFNPVASALVSAKDDSRRGPDDSFGPVDELTVDEAVEILARNEAGDWAVVRAPNGSIGWTPLERLKAIEGSLENATPILSGWIESNDTDIFSGPGIYFDKVGKLAIYDIVSVLALNERRNWALIEAVNGGRGWIPLRLIDISGSLDDLPEYSGPAVAEVTPADTGLPKSTADSATTGQLVFQKSSGGQIMIINANGTGLRQLTTGIDPVLSPDGQQVAFTRWVGDIGELWTINSNGTGEHQILGAMHKAKGPDWSPDGSQIVLNFQQGGRLKKERNCRQLGLALPNGAYDIDVANVQNPNKDPQICYTLPPDPFWNLRVINLSDSNFENYDGGTYAFRPAWDPNEPWRIVSDGGRGLVATNIDESAQQRLTEEVKDSAPVFSPDGRFLAVMSGQQGGDQGYNIFRLNSDGGGRVRLTETPLWVPVQPDSNGKLWNNVAPTWSPDGSMIAFLTDRTGRWEIWVMNADGSNQRPMFSEDINEQLDIEYNFVDERVLSWR